MFTQTSYSFSQSRFLHSRHVLPFVLLWLAIFQFSCDDAFSTGGTQNCGSATADPYCYDLEITTTLAYEVQRPVRLFDCTILVDGRQVAEYHQNEETRIFHIPFRRIYEIEFRRLRSLPVSDAGTGLVPLEMRILAMPYDATSDEAILLVLPRSRAITIKGNETQYVRRQLQNNRQEFQIKKIVFKGRRLKANAEGQQP